MGMTVIDLLDDCGIGALGDWRCGVLGRALVTYLMSFSVRDNSSTQIIL
jgi:hypothetical protein